MNNLQIENSLYMCCETRMSSAARKSTYGKITQSYNLSCLIPEECDFSELFAIFLFIDEFAVQVR